MAAGKPVVNTRLDSGVPYVSLDGETGLTVEPGEPVPLASAINRLLSDCQLRARFGAAAIRRARDEFMDVRMANRTIELYDAVLSRVAEGERLREHVKRLAG
jgi:glycosyltransferase involved in cell wall biosynthesis